MSITVQYNAAYGEAREEAKKLTVEELVFEVSKIIDGYRYNSVRDAKYRALLEEISNRLLPQNEEYL